VRRSTVAYHPPAAEGHAVVTRSGRRQLLVGVEPRTLPEVGGNTALSTLEGDARRIPCSPHDVQHSPVVRHHLKKRAGDWQLRLADWITNVAGSMPFVWLLVAIFLSAIEMIGQDRQRRSHWRRPTTISVRRRRSP